MIQVWAPHVRSVLPKTFIWKEFIEQAQDFPIHWILTPTPDKKKTPINFNKLRLQKSLISSGFWMHRQSSSRVCDSHQSDWEHRPGLGLVSRAPPLVVPDVVSVLRSAEESGGVSQPLPVLPLHVSVQPGSAHGGRTLAPVLRETSD